MTSSTEPIKSLLTASLFTALTAVGAFITIPMVPVPIVLANIFPVLAGMLLGPFWGAASAGSYLLLGAVGLPIFSRGSGGIAHLAGPTGGYLAGYLAGAVIAGLIMRLNQKNQLVLMIAAAFCGLLANFIFGIPWLKISTGMDWTKAITAGGLLFMPGMLLKCALLVSICKLPLTRSLYLQKNHYVSAKNGKA